MKIFIKIVLVGLSLAPVAALAKDTPLKPARKEPTFFLKNKADRGINVKCYKNESKKPFIEQDISADDKYEYFGDIIGLNVITIMYNNDNILTRKINPAVSGKQTAYLKFSTDNKGNGNLEVQDGILKYTTPMKKGDERYSLWNNIKEGSIK